jgi:hypothetical protein
MMRAEQRLTRNGHSTGVNIPRQILIYLGWLPGEKIVVELLEDRSLRLRRRDASDYVPLRAPRIVYDDPATVTGSATRAPEPAAPRVERDAELVTK